MLKGTPLSPGIGYGSALLVAADSPPIPKNSIKHRVAEKKRFDQAIEAAVAQIETLKESVTRKIGADNARVFEAHLLLLQDPVLIGDVHSHIDHDLVNAEFALQTALLEYGNRFEKIKNVYLRERSLDLNDVGQRVIRILTGTAPLMIPESDGPFILIARYITPAELLQANGMIVGFAMEIGAETSHTAIIARSLEIPGVTGVKYPAALKDGDSVIIDGDAGYLFANPELETILHYRLRQQELELQKTNLLQYKDLLAITADGAQIKLSANINDLNDLTLLSQAGVTGVGLFRTEFMFLHQTNLPTEAEQFAVYKKVLETLADKPVILRTLDIGGDKGLPAMTVTDETNPFLGYRALRLCLDQPDIFKTQLRAILRASVYGNLKILLPLVGSLEELRAAHRILNFAKAELRAAGVNFKENIPVGVLIETPAAALITDLLAQEADFFSIGTNDLIQYTLAVDRMNVKVAHLYEPFHPAVLRLIKRVVDQAHRAGKPVGICGEMAGDIRAIPVLLGMGLDEFSMNPVSLPAVKNVIRGLNYRQLREAASQVLELGTAAEIRSFLQELLK